MAKMSVDSDGWIVGGPAENVFPPSDGKEVEYDGDKDIEPLDPQENEEAWNWNDGAPQIQSTGNDIPPDPDEAYDLIRDQMVEWEGTTQDALNRLDDILNSTPVMDRGLANGRFDIVKNRLQALEARGFISDSERSTIEGFLDGTITEVQIG